MKRLFEIKDLLVYFKKIDKIYLIPIVLFLVIIALVVVYVSMTPAAVFIYPLI